MPLNLAGVLLFALWFTYLILGTRLCFYCLELLRTPAWLQLLLGFPLCLFIAMAPMLVIRVFELWRARRDEGMSHQSNSTDGKDDA